MSWCFKTYWKSLNLIAVENPDSVVGLSEVACLSSYLSCSKLVQGSDMCNNVNLQTLYYMHKFWDDRHHGFIGRVPAGYQRR